ncbi:long-chain-fatty-acid--[acyl-carrier-protein] ligase AEE15, chloroplastic [Gossypium raimondii]|uniref:long-chain-fatty-acid--[acyl-carrier-protein] ligase AEE15, chloroplastic n=1 Tax=Gossypium raimondii TaxID=29730 RepID=UPI00227A1551|nr:long-chain-fatty-acid--[acyl-carrier-protein] ligase AEE15, chloroplastic [Gossypium raimondii]
MFDYLWSKTIATILWPLHVLPTKFVYKKIHSAIGIQKTAKSGGGSLPMHIEKFYETIGLEVQNGYGLIETSPCVAGRQPYYNYTRLTLRQTWIQGYVPTKTFQCMEKLKKIEHTYIGYISVYKACT